MRTARRPCLPREISLENLNIGVGVRLLHAFPLELQLDFEHRPQMEANLLAYDGGPDAVSQTFDGRHRLQFLEPARDLSLSLPQSTEPRPRDVEVLVPPIDLL